MNDNHNYNPFLDDDQQKKEKRGLFGKKNETEEQQVTTLTLKEVQNMTFPTEEEKTAEQPVVPQGPTVEHRELYSVPVITYMRKWPKR